MGNADFGLSVIHRATRNSQPVTRIEYPVVKTSKELNDLKE